MVQQRAPDGADKREKLYNNPSVQISKRKQSVDLMDKSLVVCLLTSGAHLRGGDFPGEHDQQPARTVKVQFTKTKSPCSPCHPLQHLSPSTKLNSTCKNFVVQVGTDQRKQGCAKYP